MEVAPVTIYGLISSVVAMLLSHIGIWIREGRKARTFKKKNDQLGSISEKIDTIDEKQDKQTVQMKGITTAVEGMKIQCAERIAMCSTARSGIASQVKQNTDNLFKLAKNTKK